MGDISKRSNSDILQSTNYQVLLGEIGTLLSDARSKVAYSVNTILVDTYWQIGKYIVEYEQYGSEKAEYGSNLVNRLSADLSRLYGKGFSKSNLLYMRKFYVYFPKGGTLSHLLSWSHYYEILKADDPLEISFYTKECEKEGWSVRELKRQMKSMLFHRLALSKDKEGVLRLAMKASRYRLPKILSKTRMYWSLWGCPTDFCTKRATWKMP